MPHSIRGRAPPGKRKSCPGRGSSLENIGNGNTILLPQPGLAVQAIRDGEKIGQLLREAQGSTIRLQMVFKFIEDWLGQLNLPEDTDRLTRATIALLRVEQEAQRRFPGLCR